MRIYQYIYYFFNSVKNRGLLFTLKLMYCEWKFERKLGIQTIQIKNLDGLTLASGNGHNAHHYQGASYYFLNKLFSKINTDRENNGFIDFGCGKGRALILAAQYGFKNIYGVELAKELCGEADANIQRVKHAFPDAQFHICFADAAHFDIPDQINVFYFFNPFPAIVMRSVLINIEKSLDRKLRKVYVVYVNPVHAEVFIANGYSILYALKSKHYTEGLILSNSV